MGFLLFVLFLLLVFSLSLTMVKKGRFAKWSRIIRWSTAIAAIGFFAYWFFESSSTRYQQNSLSTQVVNKLPVTLDFYLIKIEKNKSNKYNTKHIGKIRPEHFRIEYLNMKNSDEFWVIGYLGKESLVYFSQHSVPNKNMDQIVEVNNYLIQSVKLSNLAKAYVNVEQEENIGLSIWISMDLLLLFLNLALLLKRK